ncbi:MAG: ATP-dependent zinc protease [Gammaproteobacteria bacterium]|nr:ATP-dependent zinc protease [Gammaproteobacteria bacterium]
MPRAAAAAVLLVAGLVAGYTLGVGNAARRVLDPVVMVRIGEAGLDFRARLDTGAVVSSINAHDLEVVGGSGRPALDDIGREIRFTLVNDAGEQRRLGARIEQVRGIRMADCREVRYHVYLTVFFRGHAYRVLTNLNDRSKAGDKLLLGRNWLYHGYAVGPVEEVEL